MFLHDSLLSAETPFGQKVSEQLTVPLGFTTWSFTTVQPPHGITSARKCFALKFSP